MNEVDTVVGQRIRALRSSQGLTQTELAQAIGVTFQQIQKYESGANRVSASRLLDLSVALRVPIGHFFEGLHMTQGADGRRGEGTSAPLGELMADQSFLCMARDFLQLSSHQRRAVAELVQSIARSTGIEPASVASHGP